MNYLIHYFACFRFLKTISRTNPITQRPTVELESFKSLAHFWCNFWVPIYKNRIHIRVLNMWSWIALGQMHRFSRCGHRGHWQVAHKPSFMCHLSVVSHEQELEKLYICPKVIQVQLLKTLIHVEFFLDFNNLLIRTYIFHTF